MGDRVIGVGPTNELSTRVSVATLCRVVFPHPENGATMLALEHKAMMDYHSDGSRVIVKAQPFGGGIRILDNKRLSIKSGRFNFDSKRSRSEGDFRIFIKPGIWGDVRDFCIQNLGMNDSPVLESDPTRELVEEFHDALGVQLAPNLYSVEPAGIIVEENPAPTANLRAAGQPTARIYRIYKVRIIDQALQRLMLINSQSNTASTLRNLVFEDAQKGGKGRANAILVVSEERIRKAYNDLSPENRAEPLALEGTLLEGNVAAVLDGVNVPKYQNID